MSLLEEKPFFTHKGGVRFLTFAGLIPFVFFMLYEQLGLNFADHVMPVAAPLIFLFYGVVIVSFLSGMHWGIYLNMFQKDKQNVKLNLFIISNVFALLGWGALLISNIYYTAAIVMLMVSFIALYLIDARLYYCGVITGWFCQLRLMVTVLVLLCCTFML